MKIATLPGFEFQLMAKDAAQELGIEFIPSTPTTEQLMIYADQISPDNWCLDVKLMFASVAKAIQDGADTIFLFHYAHIIIDFGPCLLPWAFDIYFNIALKKLFPRKKFRIFSFEWWRLPLLILNVNRALSSCGYKNYKSLFIISRSIRKSWEKIAMFQDTKTLYYQVGALNYAKYHKQYLNIVNLVKNEKDLAIIKLEVKKFQKSLLQKIKQSKQLLQIGVIGDFYTLVLEKYPFFDLERLLLHDLEVSIHQPFTFYSIFDRKSNKELSPYFKRARQYIKYWIGGSDYYNIPQALLLKDEKVSGIVHASVFACHPEAITKNVFTMIDQLEGLPPILELTFDSHTQEEAVKVRLEAFIDMLRSRNKKQ